MPSPYDTSLVVFTGPKGSGKSTAAQYLVNEFGYVEINFADKLKQICAEIYSVDLKRFYDHDLKKQVLPGTNMTARTALLSVADFLRHQNPLFFVGAWEKLVHISDSHRIVVTDLRLPVEFQALSQFPNKRIIMIKPGKAQEKTDSFEDEHDTEKHWSTFKTDAQVTNSKSIKQLHQAIRLVLTA